MGKKAVLGIITIIILGFAVAVYMNPSMLNNMLNQTSTTINPGTQETPTTTTSPPQESTTETPGSTGEETQSPSQVGQGGGEERNLTKLPKLAVNVTLEDLERVVKGNTTSTGEEVEQEECLDPSCSLVLEYYNRVMKEDMNLTPLFDTSLLNETALLELHKALYEKYDLLNYTITWLFNLQPEEEDRAVPGYDTVYILPYNFTGTYRDTTGKQFTITRTLVTFVGYNATTDQFKILQTVPLESHS